MATNDHSGYPLKWFKDQDSARSSFECAVCLEVLKDPVQVRDCGHQFCGLCIDDILMSDPRCPSCRITISKTMIFQDHAANRMIRKLDVNCSNEDCSWLGNLSSYLEDHVKSCLFRNQAGGSNNNLDARKLEEQFAKLDLEITALKQEREIDKNEMREWKTKHENDVKQLTSKHENDVKQLTSKHENDVKQLTSKHEKDVGELKTKHQEDIKEFKEEINEINQILRSNCSGTYTMKICDIEDRLRQAKFCGFENTINGEPFFTSCYGYKTRLRIVLDEKERGFTGHMGVYLYLLRSDHDDTLQWPFNKVYTFSVIDQQHGSGRNDHVKTVVPQGQAVFERPQQGGNKGHGFKSFISHSNLDNCNYIKNDVVYIKVQIEP